MLLALSAAYRRFPEGWLVMARPVNIEWDAELFTTATPLARFTAGDQALMVPSKVAHRKGEDSPCNWNSDDPLKTFPVGDPGAAPEAGGTLTTNVVTLVPLPV